MADLFGKIGEKSGIAIDYEKKGGFEACLGKQHGPSVKLN
ncbi:MAG: hypothetical protein CM1200mP30_08830 [Pseudomonadota bacterium]|nr:MAG: hypothetical protein CM1200mP30_08830 [Pseudomonadota bacterium]